MATLTERLLLLIDADSSGAAREFDNVSGAAKKADKSVGDFGATMKQGLAFGAAAFVGGSLADSILGVGQAFLDSAKGVQQFAAVTNSTTKEASQFMGMAQAMGLDVNDLLEIVAESVPNFQKYRRELEGIGVELQKNADGSVNVARSLTDALEGLQGMADGAGRMQLAMKLFGEEGSKQLAAIYNGAKPVQEALEDLDLGISDAEIAKATEFNEAMTDLKVAGRDLGFALVSTVLPTITTLSHLVGPLASALADIPPELLLIGGGLLAFQRFTPGFAGLGGAVRTAADNFRYLSEFTTLGGQQIGAMRAAAMTATGAFKSLGSSIVNAFGGPVGASIVGATVAFGLFESAIAAFDKTTDDTVTRFKELESGGKGVEEAMRQAAEETASNLSAWERLGAEAKGVNEGMSTLPFGLNVVADKVTDFFTGTSDAANEARKNVEKFIEEEGELAAISAFTADAQQALTDAIVQSGAGSREAAEAAAAAAEQKSEEERITREAQIALERAMGTYDEAKGAVDGLADAQTYLQNAFFTGHADMATFLTTINDVATTTADAEAAQQEYADALDRLKRPLSDVIELQRDYAGLTRDVADAQDGLISAIETARETTDDASTDVDENAAAWRDVADAAATFGSSAIDAVENVRERVGPGSEFDAAIAEQIAGLEAMKNAPGISPEAQAELQTAIDQLTTLGDEAVTVSQTPVTVGVTVTGVEDARNLLATMFPGTDLSTLSTGAVQYLLDLVVGTEGVPEAQTEVGSLLGPEGLGWATDVGVSTSGVPEALDEILTLLGPSAPGSGIAAPTPEGRAWQASILVQQFGAAAAGGEVDDAATPSGNDRTAPIVVESRGGPAVESYIDSVAEPGGEERLAIMRVESRNGPAVIAYLDSIDDERLAIIRVESRNGPAVISYLDSIATERLAIIRVETRNGPAVDQYLDGLANNFGAGRTASISQVTAAASGGTAAPSAFSATNRAAPLGVSATATAAPTVVQNTYRITNEVALGVNPVEVGRATVNAIRAFEGAAGAGWRSA